MTRVRDALAGQRFFITGATGFLGTALVERILRSVPDSQVVSQLAARAAVGCAASPTAATARTSTAMRSNC